MELNQLKCFMLVAHTQSVSRAAEQLFISQSALSRVILRLEEELGTKLFDRRKDGFTLTSNGRTFLEHISVSLAEIDIATRKISQNKDGHTLRISSMLTADYGKNIIQECQKEFPGYKLESEQLRSFLRFYEWLDTSSAHLVLSAINDIKNYRFTHAFSESWCLIHDGTYPFATNISGPEITLEQLSREQVSLRGSRFDWFFVAEVFRNAGLEPNNIQHFDIMEDPSALHRERRLELVPKHVFRDLRKDLLHPVHALRIQGDPFTRNIYLGLKNGFPVNPLEMQLLNRMVHLLSEQLQATDSYFDQYISTLTN